MEEEKPHITIVYKNFKEAILENNLTLAKQLNEQADENLAQRIDPIDK